MKRLITPLIVLISILTLNGQEDQCHLTIGTNLAGPTDYGSEWPFVNIMKNARTWETTNAVWTGGRDLWNTELLSYFEFDEQGYPLEVPLSIDHPNADTIQVVRTVWANTDALPEGEYVLLYEGKGRIEWLFDATLVSEEPGRMVIDVQHGGNIMGMYIMESQRGDHIRNIRLYLPGTEGQDGQSPWSSQWLDKLEPFSVLRFMDWGHTNNSTLNKWTDRPLVDDYTYTPKGIPYEYWIEICNLKNADAWICVPHRADEAYVRSLARMFRDNLDPELKIYVEYSNEVWNWIFDQAHYCNDSLSQSLEWPERIGPKVAEIMSIWTDEFSGQEDRLVRVMSTQHGWFDIGSRVFQQIMNDGQSHLIDAISPAAYMSVDHEELANLGADATGEDVISGAREITFDQQNWSMMSWYAHADLARSHDKQLLFYEGGQHFTPDPWGTVQPYNLALLEAQILPEMYDLYQELIDTLASLSQEEMVMMHFSFIAPLGDQPEDARWGSFGALTSQFFQDEPYDGAPKYRALRDHIEDCRITTAASDIQSISFCDEVEVNRSGLSMPRQEIDTRIEVFTIDGRILWEKYVNESDGGFIPWSLPQSGVLLMRITQEEGQCVQTIMLMD